MKEVDKNMKQKIVLPKKDKNGEYYLSYSQINTWKRSKRNYMRQYFYNEKFEGNSFTDFGSVIGTALELRDFSKFSKTDQKLLKTIPREERFELEIKWKFEGFYIKGYIDSCSDIVVKETGAEINKIIDYKTGSIETKQDEYKSDKYNQLVIYAAALQQEFGIKPLNASVVLIDREGNPFKGKKLKLGDKWIEIPQDISDEAVEKTRLEIIQIAYEISEYYILFEKLNKLK